MRTFKARRFCINVCEAVDRRKRFRKKKESINLSWLKTLILPIHFHIFTLITIRGVYKNVKIFLPDFFGHFLGIFWRHFLFPRSHRKIMFLRCKSFSTLTYENAFKSQSDHVKHLYKSRLQIRAHKDHDPRASW